LLINPIEKSIADGYTATRVAVTPFQQRVGLL